MDQVPDISLRASRFVERVITAQRGAALQSDRARKGGSREKVKNGAVKRGAGSRDSRTKAVRDRISRFVTTER